MQERRRSGSAVRAWTSSRVQASFHVPSVALEWAATASFAMAASIGCTRNTVGSSAWQRTRITDVQGAGNCTPLGRQTTKGSPSRTWQAGGGSFLLLARRHALSSRWLWTFNHNTYENRLEEVQGAATSSLFTPPLFQDMWPCVQLLCAECNAPCQWDLAIDKTKPPTSAAEWQGNDQTDLQCQAKTLSQPGPMSYLRTLGLRIRTWFWRREGSTGMDVWNAPMVQSKQPFTYRLRESMGLGGQDGMEVADREGL